MEIQSVGEGQETIDGPRGSVTATCSSTHLGVHQEKLKRLQLLEQKLRRLKTVGEDVQQNVRS
eukprot:754897-Hanusia_phi.AAC.5